MPTSCQSITARMCSAPSCATATKATLLCHSRLEMGHRSGGRAFADPLSACQSNLRRLRKDGRRRSTAATSLSRSVKAATSAFVFSS